MTIVALGSVNADFQVRVPQPPEGSGTIMAVDLLRTSGGKAANVAVLARRLGHEAILLGCVGDDDLAEQAVGGPEREGVDIRKVRRIPGSTGFSSIVVAPGGDKTIVLALNANDQWAGEAGAVAQNVSAAGPGAVLVADLEIPVDIVVAAVKAASGSGIPVVLDPAPPDRVTDELLRSADHLTPDHREAGTLTDCDTTTPDGALTAAEALCRRGAAAVYVKLSVGGCAVVTSGTRAIVGAPEDLDVVDTTGAGDAFAGGLASALADGSEVIDAAVVAVAASSCAVQAYGSQESYPSRSELSDMAARISVLRR